MSVVRQGLFHLPFILILPGMLGMAGPYLAQPAADALTPLVCAFSIRPMKRIASEKMGRLHGKTGETAAA